MTSGTHKEEDRGGGGAYGSFRKQTFLPYGWAFPWEPSPRISSNAELRDFWTFISQPAQGKL